MRPEFNWWQKTEYHMKKNGHRTNRKKGLYKVTKPNPLKTYRSPHMWHGN